MEDLVRYEQSGDYDTEYLWVVTEQSPNDVPKWDFNQIDEVFVQQEEESLREYATDDPRRGKRSMWISDTTTVIVGKRKDGIFFVYYNLHRATAASEYVGVKIWYAFKWHNLYWYCLDDTQRKMVPLMLPIKRWYPPDIAIITLE